MLILHSFCGCFEINNYQNIELLVDISLVHIKNSSFRYCNFFILMSNYSKHFQTKLVRSVFS